VTVTEPEQKSKEESPVLTGIRRIGLALTIPLIGAAVLWWLPNTQSQTITISLLVIVLGLAGWWYWRDDD
jgi:hypothetical protein